MARILLVCGIAVMAVVLWMWTRDGPIEAPPVAEPVGVQQTGTEPGASRGEPVEREPVVEAASEAGTEDATEPAFDKSPVIVERYTVHVLVVDPKGRGVPDATVEVFDGRKTQLDPNLPRRGGWDRHYAYTSRDPDAAAILAARTGLDGRCDLELDREMAYVMASADGVGKTNDISVWSSRVPEELVLTLERRIRLDGLVLRADGTPAAGVTVDVRRSGGSSARVGMPTHPEPVDTDAEGRFVVFLQSNTIYGVRASDGEQRTFSVSVSTTGDTSDRQVTLEFRGARTVRGFVLDANGAPVAGASVRLWEEYEIGVSDPDSEPFRGWADSGEDGGYRIDLPYAARYQLVATAEGHANNAPVWVEITDARPHVDVDLRLGRLGTIAGVVVDERGAPIPGAVVVATAEQGEWRGYSAIPTRRDLFPRPERAETELDGTFELTGVHPGTTWRLVVVPDPERRSVTASFAGHRVGEGSVSLRIDDAQRRGSAIVGTVVDAATGAPVEDYELRLADYVGDELRGTRGVGSGKDGHAFVIEDLPFGSRVGVAVLPKDLAPVFLGPIETTAERLEVVARVAPFAEVTCRVVDGSGAPMFGVHVGPNPLKRVPGAPFYSAMATDQQGERRFGRLPPGRTEFVAWSNREKLASVEVELVSGLNADVVLRIER